MTNKLRFWTSFNLYEVFRWNYFKNYSNLGYGFEKKRHSIYNGVKLLANFQPWHLLSKRTVWVLYEQKSVVLSHRRTKAQFDRPAA